MTPHELKLAVQFLRDYASELSNHGCNDWEWPADWTPEHRAQFWVDYHAFNGSPPEDLADNLKWGHAPLDWQVALLLAHKLGGGE